MNSCVTMSARTSNGSDFLTNRAMELAKITSKPAANVESGCLRMLLSKQGLDFGEQILFGLDSSFGFMFHQLRGTDPDIVVGKSEIWPCQATRLLGMQMQSEAFPNIEMVEEKTKELSVSNRALVIRVDMGMLPYLDKSKRRHFGGHFILSWGAEEGQFLVTDPFMETPLLLSANDLQRARTSKFSPPINPNSYTCWFDPPTHHPNLQQVGRHAVSQTARTILRPPIKNFGLSGLHVFAAAVTDWPITKGDGLRLQLMELSHQIDDFGTGGGLMRPLFSSFLIELGDLLAQNSLCDAAANIEQSGIYWTQLAQLCREGAQTDNPSTVVPELVRLISAIINYEHACFKLLRRT